MGKIMKFRILPLAVLAMSAMPSVAMDDTQEFCKKVNERCLQPRAYPMAVALGFAGVVGRIGSDAASHYLEHLVSFEKQHMVLLPEAVVFYGMGIPSMMLGASAMVAGAALGVNAVVKGGYNLLKTINPLSDDGISQRTKNFAKGAAWLGLGLPAALTAGYYGWYSWRGYPSFNGLVPFSATP